MAVNVYQVIENADDLEMAALTLECISWLADEGRSAAREIQEQAGPDMNWEEALSWLNDIAEGKDIS